MATSNTLGGVNLAAVAQQTLDTLLAELPMLNMFATDFSDDPAVPCGTISTRVATATGTASDLSTGYAANAANTTTTAKTITLGALTGKVIGFSDAEWAKSGVNLYSVFAYPVAYSVASYLVDAALDLVTEASYGAAAFTGPAADFDCDKLTDVAKTLTDNGVSKRNRFALLNTSYFAALAKSDEVKIAMYFGGAEGIRRNEIPSLRGFSPVAEYAGLDDNSENLVGIAGAPQGIIMAARLPAIPEGFNGDVEVATDPASGLSIQIRRWYSADDGRYYMSGAMIPGVAVGNASNLVRLVSA